MVLRVIFRILLKETMMKNNTADESRSSKITRYMVKWIGVIVLIAIIVANFILWRGYFSGQSELDVLKGEVEAVNQQISQAVEPPVDLDSKLTEAEDGLTLALQVFPGDVDRNDVVDFILNTAETCDVQIIPLVFDGWQVKRIGQSYMVLKYQGTVIGKVSDATNFITMLCNSDYPTLMITECTVERTSALEISIPDSEIGVTIDLEITLFTHSA
jgi:hypothetical protein